MKKTEKLYYVIVTKYGFLLNVFEDYSDIEKENEHYCIANAEFTNSIKSAAKFKEATEIIPKYAVTKKDYEISVKEWAEEIGGELIMVKETLEERLKMETETVLDLNFYEKKEYILQHSDLFKKPFEKHPVFE